MLESAHEFFSRGGYDRTGVAAILKRANLQAPTLYHHFQDKEGLYVAWAVQILGKLEVSLKEISDRQGSLRESLVECTKVFMRSSVDLRQMLHDIEHLENPANRDGLIGVYQHGAYSPIYTIISRGYHRKECKQDATRPMIETFMAGALAQGALWDSPTETQKGAEWWVSLFLGGVA